MSTIIDVAEYILEKQGKMTTMKLQKLCYYSQAWSLAWEGVPLFDEEFEAWANGPASPVLFNKHRGTFVVDKGFFAKSYDLHDEQKGVIDDVLKCYGDKEPHWLSDLTHGERPW